MQNLLRLSPIPQFFLTQSMKCLLRYEKWPWILKHVSECRRPFSFSMTTPFQRHGITRINVIIRNMHFASNIFTWCYTHQNINISFNLLDYFFLIYILLLRQFIYQGISCAYKNWNIYFKKCKQYRKYCRDVTVSYKESCVEIRIMMRDQCMFAEYHRHSHWITDTIGSLVSQEKGRTIVLKIW